jgi:hypothetical protein
MMVPIHSLADVRALDAGRLNTAALKRACRGRGTKRVIVLAAAKCA